MPQCRSVAVSQSPSHFYIVVPCTSAAVDQQKGTEVRGQSATVLWVLVMAVTIASIDVLFFKHRFWERLMVNVGLVLVFGGFYLRFVRRP